MTKVCNECKIEKDIQYFPTNTKIKSGRGGRCKACKHAQRMHKLKTDPKSREAARRNYTKWADRKINKNLRRGSALRRKYWPSETSEGALRKYEELLISQDYCCALCKKHCSNFKRNLDVDHSHQTGQIRGALCYRCNHQLVRMHTEETALAVYNYLVNSRLRRAA